MTDSKLKRLIAATVICIFSGLNSYAAGNVNLYDCNGLLKISDVWRRGNFVQYSYSTTINRFGDLALAKQDLGLQMTSALVRNVKRCQVLGYPSDPVTLTDGNVNASAIAECPTYAEDSADAAEKNNAVIDHANENKWLLQVRCAPGLQKQ